MLRRFRLPLLFALALLAFSACAPLPATPLDPYHDFVGTIVALTLTAWPNSSPTPMPAPSDTALPTPTVRPSYQSPRQFIYYYFENINARNYSLTWTLLTAQFKLSLYGNSETAFQQYVDFWNTVRQANVIDVNTVCDGDLCAVAVTLQLVYDNGNFNTSTYPYTLSFDHARDTWLFDYLPGPSATPFRSPTPTPTRTPTRTPTGSLSPTRTPRPSKTPTPSLSPTRTPTRTPKVSKTPTLTRTPKPSKTPVPTATLKPTRPTLGPIFTRTATLVSPGAGLALPGSASLAPVRPAAGWWEALSGFLDRLAAGLPGR
jgi:hypothetical protein